MFKRSVVEMSIKVYEEIEKMRVAENNGKPSVTPFISTANGERNRPVGLTRRGINAKYPSFEMVQQLTGMSLFPRKKA